MSKTRDTGYLNNIIQYSPTGVSVVSGSTTLLNISSSGALTTTGTITAQTLVVQTITSSVSAITGSTKFGTLDSNTHQFTGSMFISGSSVLVGTTTSNGFKFKLSNNGAEEIAMNPGDSANLNNYVNYNRSTSTYIAANYLASTHAFLNGNVGIGTSSPGNLLSIEKAKAGSGVESLDMLSLRITGTTQIGDALNVNFYNNNNTNIAKISALLGADNVAYGTLTFSTRNYNTDTVVEAMRISNRGHLKACNFANPTYSNNYHQIFNSVSADWIMEVAQYSTVPYGLLLRYANAAPRSSGAEMMYINDSTGNVFKITSNGNVYNLNGVYSSLSDIKLKENIVDTTPKLDKLMQVRIRNYNLKTDPNLKQIGVIAQELEPIFPGLIEENYDRDAEGKLTGGTSLGVKYSVFVPILIKAIQELKAENDTLKEILQRNNIQ